MRYRKAIEIGVMLFGRHPFLPRLQVGQWVLVDGNRGRWVGLSPGGVVWIIWPNTCGKRNVNEGLRVQAKALRALKGS